MNPNLVQFTHIVFLQVWSPIPCTVNKKIGLNQAQDRFPRTRSTFSCNVLLLQACWLLYQKGSCIGLK